MTGRQFTLYGSEGDEQFVTLYIPGSAPLVAGSTHPNFKTILGALIGDESADDTELAELFDVAAAVASRFESLSTRVSVSGDRVYFDGDEIHDTCTEQIVRFLDEGVNDWMPLVLFLENVGQNPTEHSRTQLYDWLSARDFTISAGGMIVAYKGVDKQGDGTLVSVRCGKATVNGEVHEGQIPNAIGSVVTMPRSEVAHDPSTACSTGLHVGTFECAKGFARGALLKVYVNPRDVVSVPTDASGQKVRVCRYTVIEVIDAPETAAVTTYDSSEYDTDKYDEYDNEPCDCAYCQSDPESYYPDAD